MSVQTSSGRRHDSSDSHREILAVAQRLFRTVGYRKTTVADIAAELGMSPANVYRFFDSKKSINEGVAELLLAGITDELLAITEREAGAPERLADFLRTLAQLSEERFMTNRRVNDMVEDAMAESWSVCVRYSDRVQQMIARIIEDGRGTGAFAVADPATAAACVKGLMICFMHPTMIALSADNDRAPIDRVIAFALRGLGCTQTA